MKRSLDEEMKDLNNAKSKDQDPKSDQTQEIYKETDNKIPVNV